MKRVPVESSMISDVDYDSETETLEIGFHSGGVYQYFEIPPGEYKARLEAPSKGRYFLENAEPFYVCAKIGRLRRW